MVDSTQAAHILETRVPAEKALNQYFNAALGKEFPVLAEIHPCVTPDGKVAINLRLCSHVNTQKSTEFNEKFVKRADEKVLHVLKSHPVLAGHAFSSATKIDSGAITQFNFLSDEYFTQEAYEKLMEACAQPQPASVIATASHQGKAMPQWLVDAGNGIREHYHGAR